MPISQARLITQNNAAFLSLRALEIIRKNLRAKAQYILEEKMDYKQAYIELSLLIEDDSELFPPTQAFAPELEYIASTYVKILHVVMEERKHFIRNAKRNANAAEYQRFYRDQENPDRKRRSTQTQTLFESTNIIPPPPKASSIPTLSFDPETQAAYEADMERARAFKASQSQSADTSFEIQTPPLEPTDYSSERDPSTFTKLKLTLNIPEGEETFEEDDSDPSKPPPSGVNS